MIGIGILKNLSRRVCDNAKHIARATTKTTSRASSGFLRLSIRLLMLWYQDLLEILSLSEIRDLTLDTKLLLQADRSSIPSGSVHAKYVLVITSPLFRILLNTDALISSIGINVDDLQVIISRMIQSVKIATYAPNSMADRVFGLA